jgi:hypothetical protein
MLIIKSKNKDFVNGDTVDNVVAEIQSVAIEPEVAVAAVPAPATPNPVVSTEQNVTITESTIDNNIQNQ